MLSVATDLSMGPGAWIMLFVGIFVLGGGLAVCINRALVVERRKREEDRASE